MLKASEVGAATLRSSLQKIRNALPQEDNSNNIKVSSAGTSSTAEAIKEQARLRGQGVNPAIISVHKDVAGNIITAPKYTEAQYHSGAVKEINWSGKATGYQLMLPDTGQIGAHINDLAVTFAAYRDKILRQTSGEEQAGELKKLDELILTEMNRYAEEFSDKASVFLSKYGFSGERDEIFSGMVKTFEGRVTEAEAFVSKNPGYSGVRGTADAWMESDEEFMRQMLHHAMSVKKPEMKTVGGSYSADDLQAIGSMMKATGELRSTYNESDRNLFEAQFAAYAIKTETVFSSLEVNADLRDKLGSIFRQAVSDTIDNANAILEQYRNEPYVKGEKEFRYRAHDKAAILDMLNRVTEGIQTRRPLRDVLSVFDGLLQSLYQERTLGLHGSDSSFAQSVNTFAGSLGAGEVPLRSGYLDVAY